MNHLLPVLMDMKRKHPYLNKLHFMSDGAVTQNKGTQNIHFMANIPLSLGFEAVWWNFSEANQEKGQADGSWRSHKTPC